MKTKKRKKSSRQSGRGMGTHGTGARKNQRDSGNRGGIGLAGTGKRADQKKTLITKKYGGGYFGKKGVTSIGTKRDKALRLNIGDIDKNLDNYIKKGLAKPSSSDKESYEINLEKYKILGTGDVKNKLKITADSASESAKQKVQKASGEIVVKEKKKKEKTDNKEQKKASEKNQKTKESKKETKEQKKDSVY